MSQGFIMLKRSEKLLWLIKNHIYAYGLLSIIALRARRTSNSPDGYEIGECHIGDYLSAGIPSERVYRTAKDVLVRERAVIICETCRSRKKSTTGQTTYGTKVKLLNSEFFDINIDLCDDRIDDRPTTDRRPTDDEQQRTRKKKKLASLVKDSVEKKDDRFSLTKKQAIGSSTVGLPAALPKKNSDEFDGIKIYCEAHEVDFSDKTIQSLLKEFDVQMIVDSLRVANNTPGVRSKAAFAIKILNDMKKQGKIHAIHG